MIMMWKPVSNQFDPFLLLDNMDAKWEPGEAQGAPDHPHRVHLDNSTNAVLNQILIFFCRDLKPFPTSCRAAWFTRIPPVLEVN
jgi:hypothetical protein